MPDTVDAKTGLYKEDLRVIYCVKFKENKKGGKIASHPFSHRTFS